MAQGSKATMASTREISHLILQARKKKKLKQEVLALQLGCSRSYISKLEKGIALPSPSLAEKLEAKLSLPKGELVRSVVQIKLRESTLKRQAVKQVRDGQTDSFIPIPKDGADGLKSFLLKAVDESMNKAGIRKGDILLVEMRPARNHDICVFSDGTTSNIRRYVKMDGVIRMTPESSEKKFKPAAFKPDNIEIHGIVKGQYLHKK
jgi:transcriptional regulator with XRE-family HTH domain